MDNQAGSPFDGPQTNQSTALYMQPQPMDVVSVHSEPGSVSLHPDREVTQPEPPPPPPHRLDISLCHKLNLADYQNAVPLLRELVVINDSLDSLSGLELSIESSPAFLKPRTWRIDGMGPRSRYHITQLDVSLDGALLSRLTEAEVASVVLVLRRVGETSELVRVERQLELLPRNQWGGLSHMPDLVAAFVQPNEPAVERLLKKAAELLRHSGKSSALNGYEAGAQHAWEIASAIWNAMAGMKLDYALPPASFEFAGQKVRGPGKIEESGLATCLDTTLFFCAALEQAGLNPLVIFTKGHAFVGVWLKAGEFSTTVVDDVTALRKRIKLKELVLFETTLVTGGSPCQFSFAVDKGAEQLTEDKDAEFELAVDIRRARMQRIKPLASTEAPIARGAVTGASADDAELPTLLTIEGRPDLPDDAEPVDIEPAKLSPQDRLARWQRKLLDLSLRNNLLNFKVGKRGLKLEAPEPGDLEDLLADGQELRLLPRPDLMDGADPRSQAIYEGRERENLRREHALDALKRREVFVSVPESELEARLVDLFRTARTTLQEGGANTLYLALGFLSWTRDDRPGQRYRAPLILVPVALNRKSVRSGFTLSLHEDEPRFNPTLLEMLRQDFKLSLGVVDGELPKDESGLDIAGIWKSVAHAIKDIKGWEVTEDVTLAMFSFAKFLMWKDLTERTEQLRQNAVVRHLIDTPRDSFSSSVKFTDPRRLDAELSPEQTFCPLPADSSQLSAVLAAARGKDFVLIGPPGTGKSQTIANLIAQCLAENKRVLFVSEKIAALDVVYRRLREVGLGEFCLELHSSKARKADILEQLKRSWEARGGVDEQTWQSEAQRLRALRDQLNSYVEHLHFRYPNGLTIYQAIGHVTAGEWAPALNFKWSSPREHNSEQMVAMRSAVQRLGINATAAGASVLTTHPLRVIERNEWSPGWQEDLAQSAARLVEAAKVVQSAYEHYMQALSLTPVAASRPVRGALAMLVRALPSCVGHDWSFAAGIDAKEVVSRLNDGVALIAKHQQLTERLSPQWPEKVVSDCSAAIEVLRKRRELFQQLGQPWANDVMEELQTGLVLLARIEHATKSLSVSYADGIEQLNVAQLQREWTKAEQAIWPVSWLGKRGVAKQLQAVASGVEDVDPAKDLSLLMQIRELRFKVGALELGAGVKEVWNGLRTRADFVESAMKFQKTLAAVRAGNSWDDTGFESIAGGRCGPRLQNELSNLRSLRDLDAQLAAMESLNAATGGLWQGLATDVERLVAALSFVEELRAIRQAGTLKTKHPAVSAGTCGATLLADLQIFQQRAEIEQQLANLASLKDKTGGLWKGLQTSADEVAKACRFQSAIEMVLTHIASDPTQLNITRQSLTSLIANSATTLGASSAVVVAGMQYLKAWQGLQPAMDQLTAWAGLSAASKAQQEELSLDELQEQCSLIGANLSRLKTWCAWVAARQDAIRLGLSTLVAAIENGGALPDRAPDIFEINYSRWWLVAIVDMEPVVRKFVSAEHEKAIADFRMLDDRFTKITRDLLRARLCAELPQQDSVSRNSEWGRLRHEMSKKRNHLPLRRLLAEIPTAVTKLTPCLLMSPLSIAQYLAAETSTFDVVVFDEASQIPVWDAIGAIARGKQVIMVGDPKQLPPTNFFDRAETDQDEEDIEGDLESILDECIGANLPTMNLSWHYRSRHESLIAFSNHRYYEGGLVTFPSPITEDRAVSFHHVKGVYEKGGSRTNKQEAMMLVADLVSRLKDPAFRASKLTIGVVTFNTEQQSLISDLLDDECRKDPSIESYFSEVMLEPVFVKNLESVQGDERDVMYFSITYGPDISGAVSMNFGPLNKSGGERRLNVAITRARHELRVFSALKAEQMDLARTQAAGVRDLKHFLDFAERGTSALVEAVKGFGADYESPFEAAIASALQRKGWVLHTQVGVSSFRVDLAVVHPDAAGIYLAGVECDGATYHRSATARDRDKLREFVLRGLGWEIVRVWSTDWWTDPVGTLEKLDAKLHTLLAVSRANRAEATVKQAEMESKATSDAHSASSPSTLLDTVKAPVSGANVEEVAINYEVTALTMARDRANQPVFVESDLVGSFKSVIDPDAFFSESYRPTLMRMIDHVVRTEAPVQDGVLAKRIARAHGWQRTGSRIQERVDLIAQQVYQYTTEDAGVFYWGHECEPTTSIPFRRALSTDTSRAVDEVCMAELVDLARAIRAGGLVDEDALVAMSRELGLQRLRAISRGRLEEALSKSG